MAETEFLSLGFPCQCNQPGSSTSLWEKGRGKEDRLWNTRHTGFSFGLFWCVFLTSCSTPPTFWNNEREKLNFMEPHAGFLWETALTNGFASSYLRSPSTSVSEKAVRKEKSSRTSIHHIFPTHFPSCRIINLQCSPLPTHSRAVVKTSQLNLSL